MDTYNMTSNDAGIQSAPLSFLRGGLYFYSLGLVGERDTGYYWDSKTSSDISAWSLDSSSTRLNPQNSYNKGFGLFIRCVVKP